jgi:hypothetical protein
MGDLKCICYFYDLLSSFSSIHHKTNSSRMPALHQIRHASTRLLIMQLKNINVFLSPKQDRMVCTSMCACFEHSSVCMKSVNHQNQVAVGIRSVTHCEPKYCLSLLPTKGISALLHLLFLP